MARKAGHMMRKQKVSLGDCAATLECRRDILFYLFVLFFPKTNGKKIRMKRMAKISKNIVRIIAENPITMTSLPGSLAARRYPDNWATYIT